MDSTLALGAFRIARGAGGKELGKSNMKRQKRKSRVSHNLVPPTLVSSSRFFFERGEGTPQNAAEGGGGEPRGSAESGGRAPTHRNTRSRFASYPSSWRNYPQRLRVLYRG